MDSIRKSVFDKLDSMDISYSVIEHPAVYTIDDMDKLDMENKNEIVKNLFIRDDKKKRYFLIVLQKDKRVDLKQIRQVLDSRPLTFASEQDLFKYLGLGKGSVTPLGVLNDSDCTVEVVLDKDILSFELVGVHPNENTATVLISPKDLESVIKDHGNDIVYIEI